jgi:hypothetical protein
MTTEIYTFGNSLSYEATRLSLQLDGTIYTDTIVIPRHPDINEDDYNQAIEDINRTFRVLKDPETDQQFEIAEANLKVDPTKGFDAGLSTFTSSLTSNLGNAIELALQAASQPNRRRLYIASPGNGKTSYWSKKERKYIRRTGRFTQEDGKALPTIAALKRALDLGGYVVTRLSTDSAGGAYGTALMRELPEGQVTHAYIKSRPNISEHENGDLGDWQAYLWGLTILMSDLLDDDRFNRASDDPWKEKLEYISKQSARQRMPRIYAPDFIKEQGIQEDIGTYSLNKLRTDMLALSRGGAAYNHPAAVDTAYALAKQSEALVTYHFPRNDRLYNLLPEDAEIFLSEISHLGALATNGQIEALIMPGGHRDHTSYPSFRWSIESYAFQRVSSPAGTSTT